MKTPDQVFTALGKLYGFQKKLEKFRIKEKHESALLREPKRKWGQTTASD